ncbi:hypothetical protein [Peterkaempfera sp. SMS 1(5)a]|uniref:hypothetical protein n=1 Tax=Peterkaempfera podocarpi TaxID=3232308 RepID=UPI0036721145
MPQELGAHQPAEAENACSALVGVEELAAPRALVRVLALLAPEPAAAGRAGARRQHDPVPTRDEVDPS